MDEPIANSSRLVLPRMTTPASSSLRVTVASYGGIQPSRIFEPAVAGTPACTTMSLSASGTPASGDDRRVTDGPGPVDRAGLRQRGFGGDVQERVHGAVDGLDPVQVRPGDLLGADLAVGDRVGQCARRSSWSDSALTAPPPGSAAPGTGRSPPTGAPASAASLVSPGRTTSSRYTLVSGTACVVGSMSGPDDDRRPWPPSRRITESCPTYRSSSASVRSNRARWARWATLSRVRVGPGSIGLGGGTLDTVLLGARSGSAWTARDRCGSKVGRDRSCGQSGVRCIGRCWVVGSVQRTPPVIVPDGDRERDSILGRGATAWPQPQLRGRRTTNLLSLAVMTRRLHGMMPRPAG